MAVSSKEIPAKSTKSGGRQHIEGLIHLLGWLGLALGVASFGGIVWAINGGYSVRGLQVVAQSFNEAGRLFWALITRWSFTIPGDIPLVNERQPLLPWCGVVAASLLQIAVLLLRLLRLHVPVELAIATVLFSLYDFGTTYFGLGTANWLKGSGWLIQGLLALVLTFTIEAVVAFLLRRVVGALTRWRQPKEG